MRCNQQGGALFSNFISLMIRSEIQIMLPSETFTEVAHSFILAKPVPPGGTELLSILGSGSRRLKNLRYRASLARNADFISLSRVLQKDQLSPN
jgi:hypothetical protein